MLAVGYVHCLRGVEVGVRVVVINRRWHSRAVTIATEVSPMINIAILADEHPLSA